MANRRDGFTVQEPPEVFSTSTGDLTLDVGADGGDRWAVFDVQNLSAVTRSLYPTVAVVFSGEGAARPATGGGYEIDFDRSFGRVRTIWEGLTVAPGETVILMHFGVQETGFDAARAAARLVELPPEALAGLEPDELDRIRSFAVPAGGTSALEPLPPLDGTLSGTVFEGDGTTPVTSAEVTFLSADLLFQRPIRISTNAGGVYETAARLEGLGDSVVLPRGGFTVSALHPVSRKLSPITPGDFAGAVSAVADVVFTDTSTIVATVRRTDAAVVSSGDVVLTAVEELIRLRRPLGTEGSFSFTGLPPGTYSLVATQKHPQGTGLSGSTTATLTAGDFADSTGRVLVDKVPVGPFTVTARNPRNVFVVSAEVGGTLGAPGEVVPVTLEVPVDRPPAVTLTAPAPGLEVTQGTQVEVRAEVVDDFGVDAVELLVDGAAVQTDRFAPYEFQEVLLAPAGADEVALAVRVTDDASNVVTTAPRAVRIVGDNEPPIVNLAAPDEGQSFIEGTRVTIEAVALDDVAVDRVEFSAGGELFHTDTSSPFLAELTLSPDLAPAALELAAKAFDRAGNSTRVTRSITVVDDEPPAIVLVDAPPSGTAVRQGETVRFEAEATDDVGVQVDLVVDGAAAETAFSAPFVFDYTVPADTADGATIRVVLRARDTRSQTAETAAVEIVVTGDEPPSVEILAPLDGATVFEGALFAIAVAAGDTEGVDRVELFVAGEAVATLTEPPYTFVYRLPSNLISGTVEVRAVATDTLGQSAEDRVLITRLRDEEAPAVELVSPADGAIVSLGETDVDLVLELTETTNFSSGLDLDGDGTAESWLDAEVFAAREVLGILSPGTSRVAVRRAGPTATRVRGLTDDFSLVETTLDFFGPIFRLGGPELDAALEGAVDDLASDGARRNANPVVFLFLRSSVASVPEAALAKAVEAGVVVHTLSFANAGGNGAVLQAIADATGGTHFVVSDPRGLGDTLAGGLTLDIDSLTLEAAASDDVAVAKVELGVTASDGSVDETTTLTEPPYAVLFGTPGLAETVDLTVVAAAEDWSGNRTTADPVTVTLLPGDNPPEAVAVPSPA